MAQGLVFYRSRGYRLRTFRMGFGSIPPDFAKHLNEQSLTCWLCGRPFGAKVQWHHTVPKAKKGKDTVAVHPICHKTIHANFTNAELARIGEDRAALLEREPLAKFVSWVASKPPDFYAPTKKSR